MQQKQLNPIILGPVVTEKSVGYNSAQSPIYTLRVSLKATKEQISVALKTLFNVDVLKVRTLVEHGNTVRKNRSKRKAITVKLSNSKKAYVSLKKGQTLNVATSMPDPALKNVGVAPQP